MDVLYPRCGSMSTRSIMAASLRADTASSRDAHLQRAPDRLHHELPPSPKRPRLVRSSSGGNQSLFPAGSRGNVTTGFGRQCSLAFACGGLFHTNPFHGR